MSDRLEKLEARLKAMGTDGQPSVDRVDLLLELAEEHFSGDDPQRLIELTNEALELSRHLDYSKGKAYGLWYESLGCCFTADHEKGLDRVDKSRTQLEEMGDDFGIAKATMLRANILRSIGDFDQALPPLYESLKYFRDTGDLYLQAFILYSLGLLYQEIKDYPQALENHRKSIEVMEGHTERWLVARALNGVGQALYSMGQSQEALDSHHRSLALFREIGHGMGEARVLDNIGSIYMEMGDNDLALPFHSKSLEIRRSIGQRRAECTSLLNIARIQIAMGNADAALGTLDEAFAIAEETGSKPHIYDAHRLYSEAFELQENFAKALHHSREFQRTKEDVFNETTADRIHKLQIGFKVQKAEQDAELAHLKSVELKEKNDALESLLKELRDTQSQLVQSEKMAALGKLVAGMVHEMNTPLGASSSAVDVGERCIAKITELQEQMDPQRLEFLLENLKKNHLVNREANDRMNAILANLKKFISLDGGQREKVDLHEGLDSAIALLANEIEGRITLVREYGDVEPVECCPAEINQVFMSLLTNAAEAIDGKGTITIRTSAAEGEFRVAVSDTGSGMSEEVREQLFDPAFSTKGKRVKAGMGLLVSLNIVRNHGGRIEVESEEGQGSTFTVIGSCAGAR
jgi:signal transduction histidine kinase